MKNPLTPAGIEPATFRFVAQHLNHCATAVPVYSRVLPDISLTGILKTHNLPVFVCEFETFISRRNVRTEKEKAGENETFESIWTCMQKSET